jgi:hypothetical protein
MILEDGAVWCRHRCSFTTTASVLRVNSCQEIIFGVSRQKMETMDLLASRARYNLKKAEGPKEVFHVTSGAGL